MELGQSKMENMVIDQLRKTYLGKKVFLTGHTGFKGSWLLSMLSLLGANVKGYALPTQNELSIFNQISGKELCESVIADIRNKEQLRNEIKSYQPDFIFHLAAQPLVRLSYEIPLETFEVNVLGTANLLDVAKDLEKPCSIIIITTDKVYDNKEWLYPYRETDKLGGYDPYSASKACAEIILNSYRQSFFLDKQDNIKGLASVRAGNVIGGGDWAADRIIPDIVRALEKEEEVVVRNPNAIRPWQHVLEPLTGYLILGANLATQPLAFSEAFNFGPAANDNLKVEELVNIAIAEWGKGNYKLLNNEKGVHEAGILKLDISKATDRLGWKPLLSSKKAISLTIDWYKSYNHQSVRNLTFNQINAYLELYKDDIY
jgi:CDP-glucose 4,6-dehydratase